MPEVIFHDRRAVQIENESLRLTVLVEGGHIAEFFDKRAGVSPLWIPHWRSEEPSAFGAESATESADRFGSGADAKLLAGIMGHNLCLDIFGGPSQHEASAGLTVHGEAAVDCYEIAEERDTLTQQLTLRLAGLRFKRTIQLGGSLARIAESIENLSGIDKPIGWTQHVTLGPPFLDPATTEFRASMTRSMVSASDPGSDAYLRLGAEFDWPLAPLANRGMADLRRMNPSTPASGYTAHLADPQRENAFFVAYTPQSRLAFGYIWKREDFPWLGIWEENRSRRSAPWSGQEVTRGMEFGVSPFPETRKEMVERGKLFGTPTYKWIPAGGQLRAEYWVISQTVDVIPESLSWPIS
ncbi:MAG: hypothetical protein WBE76_05330 [Terracidiphilus sp.]